MLLKRDDVLPIYHHLRSPLVVLALGLLEVFLVDIELYIEGRCFCAVFVLARWIGGIIGAGFEERSHCIDDEEEDEGYVEAKIALPCLCASLLARVSAERIPEFKGKYV